MREFMPELLGHLPLQFLVLCRQFLLRVVDLEALSIKADVTGFLGQFAGVLIMLSLIFSGMAVMNPVAIEQTLISWTMLVVGLITVVSWDATFPDRRDVLVLAPLPVRPRTILAAKVTASSAILGLAVFALNVVPSLAIAMCLSSSYGIFRSFTAFWIAMLAMVIFLYASVLTLQGFAALLLPRRIFLRVSALLQILAFAYFLCSFFMLPTLPVAAMALPIAHRLVAWTPSFWFYALCVQLNGVLPTSLTWVATRAWIALLVSGLGGATSLLLCYVRTLRKTVEEPDLVPAGGGSRWAVRFGSPLKTAVILFSVRALTRSRQHRVAFAFYLSIVCAIALGTIKFGIAVPAPHELTQDFLINTILMMTFAVVGLRSVFSLPISLNANWVLRITQLRPTPEYTAATRTSLMLLGVWPIVIAVGILACTFRPLQQVVGHLVIVLLIGCVLADLSLIGFYKIPFTCSYLPGKSNIQFVFWGFLVLFIPLVMQFVKLEQSALSSVPQYLWITGSLLAVVIGLRLFNRHEAKAAAIYFEELEMAQTITLGLSGI
jgi:hypothetical protein